MPREEFSYLFNMCFYPGIGLSGDRENCIAKHLQKELLRFRQESECVECQASECEIICRDMWAINRGRVVVVPTARVTYDAIAFETLPLLGYSFRFDRPEFISEPPKSVECCPLFPGRDQMSKCYQDNIWNKINRALGVPRANIAGLEATRLVPKTFPKFIATMKETFHCSEEERKEIDKYVIPANILQIGRSDRIEDFSHEMLNGVMDWLFYNPCHKHTYLSENSMEALITTHFVEEKPIFDELSTAGQRSDFMRYLYMRMHGGTYVDLDTKPHRAIKEMISSADLFVVGKETDFLSEKLGKEWQYPRSISMSLHTFAVSKGNPVLDQLVEAVRNNVKNPLNIYQKVHEFANGPCLVLETQEKTGSELFSDIIERNSETLRILGIPSFSSGKDEQFLNMQREESLNGWEGLSSQSNWVVGSFLVLVKICE